MTKSEHVTGLLVAGFYHYFLGQDGVANMLWSTAVEILDMQVPIVGDA